MEEVDRGVDELERGEVWKEVLSSRKRWGSGAARESADAGAGQLKSPGLIGRDILLIDRAGSSASGEINQVEFKGKGWERVRVQADSGAIDSVAPKSVAARLPVRVTRAAKAGLGYVAANGSRIENYGERVIKGRMGDGKSAAMAFQVSDVKRPLGSVFRMNQAGNKVVLDGKES